MLELGAYNKLPHYSVVGHPQDFYVWVNEDSVGSASKWIKGKDAFTLYNKFRNITNKSEFVALIKQVHLENRK